MSYSQETISYFPEIKKEFKEDFEKSELFTIPEISISLEKLHKVDKTIIKVLDIDSFDAAKILYNTYKEKPLVLNMASEFKPGGGWRTDRFAQEEVLFYRSTYSMSLEKIKDMYPLNKHETIYSENVCVFMNGDYKLYDWKDCFIVSCLALPGLRKPQLTKDGRLSSKDHHTLKIKLEGIFKVAIKHNHKYLVLGALGCGVFQNPPEEVAKVYKEVLGDYKNYFKEIIFAVLVVKEKDRNNLKVFNEILNDI